MGQKNQTIKFEARTILRTCLLLVSSQTHTYIPLNSSWIKLKKLVINYPTNIGVVVVIT